MNKHAYKEPSYILCSCKQRRRDLYMLIYVFSPRPGGFVFKKILRAPPSPPPPLRIVNKCMHADRAVVSVSFTAVTTLRPSIHPQRYGRRLATRSAYILLECSAISSYIMYTLHRTRPSAPERMFQVVNAHSLLRKLILHPLPPPGRFAHTHQQTCTYTHTSLRSLPGQEGRALFVHKRKAAADI